MMSTGVAIPFKWGQSFYHRFGGTPDAIAVSQSLLNEVKVSTQPMAENGLSIIQRRNPF